MGSCCCCADKGDSSNSSDGGKRDPLLRSEPSQQPQQAHQSRNDKQQQRQHHPNGNIVSASSPPPAAMNRGGEGTTPTTGPSTTSASRSLKEYELIAFLGQGTFAEVTLARHKATRELVAIKKISKRKVKEEGLVEHAFTERHLLAQLHHPSLVKLLQAFQSRTHLFLVLEFAQGGDLGSLLTGQQLLPPPSTLQQQQQHPTNHSFTTTTNSGPLVIGQPSTASSSFFTSAAAPHRVDIPLELLYFYSGEIAIVLQFLHEQHFIYRDLKPENILLKANGHLMLTDFGVAKNYANQQQHQQRETTAEGGTSGRSNSFVGTRQYMSPEMLQGLPHDAATDWWSFGCWLFEMACRRRPFDAAESEFELFKNIVEEDVVFHREELQHLLYVPQTYEDAAAGGFQLHHSYNASPPSDALMRQQSSVVFHHAAGGALFGLPNNNMSFASPLLIVNRSITRFAMQTAEQPTSTIEPSSSSPTVTKMGGGPDALAPSSASSIPQQWRDRHGAELLHHLEDLIRGLLCRDPTRRYGGHEVLAHPFFQTTKAWREVFPAAFAQLDEDEEKEEVDQAQQSMPPNNNNNHSADKKSEARCITQLKRCFALLPPPYVPKLRGSGDLRCFPYAILARHYCGGGADTAVSPNTAPRKTRKGVKGQPMPSKDLLRTIFGPDNHDNDDAAGEGPSASQPAEEKQAKPASPPSPTTAEPPAPRDGYDNNNSITLADVSYYDDAALHMSPTTILHPPPPPSIVVEHGSPIHGGRGDEEVTRQSLSDENSHTLNGSGDLFAGSSTSQALLDGRAYSDCDASSSGVPSGRNLEDMRAAALYPPQRSVVYADPLADSSSQFYYTSSPTRRHTMMGTQQPQRMNDRSNGRFSPRDGSSSTDAMSNVFVNYTYDARQGASYLN